MRIEPREVQSLSVKGGDPGILDGAAVSCCFPPFSFLVCSYRNHGRGCIRVRWRLHQTKASTVRPSSAERRAAKTARMVKDIKLYPEKLAECGVMAYPLEYMSPKLPGLGDVDWSAFVSGLHDIRYHGPAVIEVEDLRAVPPISCGPSASPSATWTSSSADGPPAPGARASLPFFPFAFSWFFLSPCTLRLLSVPVSPQKCRGLPASAFLRFQFTTGFPITAACVCGAGRRGRRRRGPGRRPRRRPRTGSCSAAGPPSP